MVNVIIEQINTIVKCIKLMFMKNILCIELNDIKYKYGLLEKKINELMNNEIVN